MIIIDKKDVDSFRYTIAKIVFLRINRDVKLIEDFPNSNVMLVKFDNGEKAYISLFRKPHFRNKKLVDKFNMAIYIYYQKKSYRNDNETNIQVRHFDKEFNKSINSNMEEAFYHTDKFLFKLSTKERDLFNSSLARINEESLLLYRYLSVAPVRENLYKEVDGVIYFSNPKSFNDPFDCNAYFENNLSMSELFRVLCLTPNRKSILMWSYYSQNHTGYCFEYQASDIVSELVRSNMTGLCIVGEVGYSTKRPPQKSRVSEFSFTDISFYIDVCFTKYNEWEHEHEYRYVIISKEYRGIDANGNEVINPPRINFTVPISNYYQGVNGENHIVKDSQGRVIPIKRLLKHNEIYELIDEN
ncbi:MAG: DUF2971 domain-containing protein [Chloroflexi bacterium]|nr:DUF2971 domain-containing protein [Chloroflexota bacterium]